MKSILALALLTVFFSLPTSAQEMFEINRSVVIQAELSKVWEKLSDVEHIEWIHGVKKVEMVASANTLLGPVRVVTIANGMILKERLTDLKPQRSLSFVVFEGLPFERYYVEFTVTAPDAQSTLFTVRALGIPAPIGSEGLEQFRGMVAGIYEQSLKNLKTLIESSK